MNDDQDAADEIGHDEEGGPSEAQVVEAYDALDQMEIDQRQALREALALLLSDGPDALLKPRYLDAARRVHLAPALADSVRATFARHAGRPVVAVHLRQGDYRLVSPERYDIGTEWPAVPLWWYRSAMTAIRQVRPDTAFFLAGNGDPMLHAELVRDFDVFTLEVESHYGYKKDDHSSRVNPVADLFALACCPVLLATPVSGFSHWAANALGTPSTCIVPMPGATPCSR